MDSLSSLHPIVLQHIESPPFQFSERGPTFKGHARESIDDLKRWLKKPKKPQNPTLGRKKDWWLAQLRLYGITTPNEDDQGRHDRRSQSCGRLRRSERTLEGNPAAEEKTGTEVPASKCRGEGEGVCIPKRGGTHCEVQPTMPENFLSGANDERLMVFWIHQEWYDGQCVHEAAANLGLHSADARGARERKLIVVGKEKVDVQNEVMDWENEYKEWRGRCRGARGRRLQE